MSWPTKRRFGLVLDKSQAANALSDHQRIIVKQAEALRTFCSGCERLLFYIRTNGALAEDEARMVEHYCKEILAKVGDYGKGQSKSS